MKFVHEYIDYPNQKNVDNGIWHYNMGKCYNYKGGNHTYYPHPNDKFFEADSWADVIKQQMIINRNNYITGWIAPDGEFFGCAAEEHENFAFYVLNKTQKDLEKSGWLKVYKTPQHLLAISPYKFSEYNYFGHPTLYQKITLEKLGIYV